MDLVISIIIAIIIILFIRYRLCLDKFNNLQTKLHQDMDMSLSLSRQYHNLKEKQSICESFQNPDSNPTAFDGRMCLNRIQSNYCSPCQLPCQSNSSCSLDHIDKDARNCKNLLQHSKT